MSRFELYLCYVLLSLFAMQCIDNVCFNIVGWSFAVKDLTQAQQYTNRKRNKDRTLLRFL